MDYQSSPGRELKNDCIAAIATAAGSGAIGIVRVSGPSLTPLLRLLSNTIPQPRCAHLCYLKSLHQDLIDQVILIYFPAPHSSTGEDVIEIQAHGGAVVLQQVLSHVLALGSSLDNTTLRLARPGEFTQRAFLNDKLDILQAEAVASLIEAKTAAAARSAMRTLKGEFSQSITQFQNNLMQLRCFVEAGIDFPEEDLDLRYLQDIRTRLETLSEALRVAVSSSRAGRILHEGLRVVLLGLPNVGKSALLNALVGEEAAIVSAIAGTTRDRIELTAQIDGYPLTLIDTAGLHESDDPIELMGMQKTRQALESADVVLWIHDLSKRDDALVAAQELTIARLLADLAIEQLDVWNKLDIMVGAADAPQLSFSATERIGIEAIEQAILSRAGLESSQAESGIFMANKRHQLALEEANNFLVLALELLPPMAVETAVELQQGTGSATPVFSMLSWDLLAETLRLAQNALDGITGSHSAEDVLDQIFSRFCIGK